MKERDVQDVYTEGARATAKKVVGPRVRLLLKLKITPNRVTFVGALLCVVACLVWSFQDQHRWCYWVAIPIFVAGSLLDLVDGAFARAADMESPFGKLLDASMDRVVDGFLCAAFAYVLARQGNYFAMLASITAGIGAFMVSYTRARSENIGVENKKSIGARPERLIVIAIGALATPWILGVQYVMYLSNVQVWVAVAQRMRTVYKHQWDNPEKEHVVTHALRFAMLYVAVVGACVTGFAAAASEIKEGRYRKESFQIGKASFAVAAIGLVGFCLTTFVSW